MRTAGATSFVSVKLSELNRLLKQDADIPVSRRFSEMLKFSSKPMSADTPTLVALTSKADFQVTELDGEDSVSEPAEETPIKGEVKVNVLDNWK